MIIDSPRKEQIPALRTLWQEAFGDTDPFLDCFFEKAFSFSRCRCITVDGAPAAALYWFDCSLEEKKIAYLYAVATKKAYQGQGLCRALMADTHSHLLARGYAGAILVPGTAQLFDFYEKMGYRTCAHAGEFICSAGPAPAAMEQIDAVRFAALRRKFLPPRAVIQEGENLTFLESQTRFYTGRGFLLAASADSDTVHGLELLGDRDAAPGIVCALGCRQGHFRTPGGERPFAMYYPLSGSAAPAYFGFAFD